jgi:hypothetical protein
MIGFIAPYIFTTWDYRQFGAIAILGTFQFTVTHALGFSAFTSRILATDLSQSHRHFKSHIQTSVHGLIHFLPLFCNCQLRGLDSIQFLWSQAHITAGWRPETRLNSIPSSYPGRLASRNSTQYNSSAPKLISRQAGVPKLDSSLLVSTTVLYC